MRELLGQVLKDSLWGDKRPFLQLIVCVCVLSLFSCVQLFASPYGL